MTWQRPLPAQTPESNVRPEAGTRLRTGGGVWLARSADSLQQWQPGEPLTEDDRTLLAPLIERAGELGRTPARREVAGAGAIKRRFRTWGNACRAAGLAWVNYPEQRRRAEAARRPHVAPDQPRQPHSDRRGDHAAGQVARHVGGATGHGGQADHETPAD